MLFRYEQRGAEAPPQVLQALQEALHIGPMAARVLAGRGYCDVEAARGFLQPMGTPLHDAMALPDMPAAAALLRDAMAAGQTICVYGDYDVDGVCAVTILVHYLRTLGANCIWYIPSRHKEGYGLHDAAVTALAAQAQVLLTVDCGISAHDQCALAARLGMQVVVTDHHQCGPTLPPAAAVVNPHRADSTYPFAQLCGAGVALKLVQALGGEAACAPYYDLAALATVADLVPLVGENRTLVKRGLAQMNAAPRVGIAALLRAAGCADGVQAYHLAFRLAPMINAGGRVALSEKSVQLLLCEDVSQADAIAAELFADNEERKAQESAILEEALQQLQTGFDYEKDRCIVLCGAWNTGVVGIVASRLVERYHRPVLLMGQGSDGCHGSGRSIEGVDLFRCLQQLQGHFIRYGGHAQAAGFTIAPENIPALRRDFNALLQQYPEELFLPRRSYDCPADAEHLTLQCARDLEKMEPFGMGNPHPVLLLHHVQASGVRTLSQDKHVRFTVLDELSCIAFGQGNKAKLLERQPVSLLVSPKVDTYRPERPRLSLQVEHIHSAAAEGLPGEGVWNKALLSQFKMPQRPGNVVALPRAQWQQLLRESIAQSCFGTLVLQYDPAVAAQTRALLDETRVYLEQDVSCRAELGENMAVAAPDLSVLPMQRYNRLFVEGCLFPESAAYLSSRLNPGGVCYIINDTFFPAAFVQHLCPAERVALGQYYQALRDALRQGSYALAAPYDPRRGDVDKRLACIIFQELGLIKPLQAAPWWQLLPAGSKRDLVQSQAYRKLCALYAQEPKHDGNLS